MTDTDYDRFMDAVSCQFEQHLQRLFPDDYGLQRIAWDAWDDFRRTARRTAIEEVGRAAIRAFPDADRHAVDEAVRREISDSLTGPVPTEDILFGLTNRLSFIITGDQANLSEHLAALYSIEAEWAKAYAPCSVEQGEVQDKDYIVVSFKPVKPVAH